MSAESPRFRVGENVRYTGTEKIGTVNKVIRGSRGYQYKITIDGRAFTVSERFLDAVVDTEENVINEYAMGEIGGHKDYKLFQTWFRLSKPLESSIYSYLGSKTLFNPFQFKPLLRFISPSSDERLYIADEVGVGKTIETGIIIKELLARGRLDYRSPILVVCPVSLGRKWYEEMKKRFDLHFHLHDGSSLRLMLKRLLSDGILPQGYILSIVGLQLLRRREYIDMLEEIDSKREGPLFDLTVIDEAHHMRNSETDSNELGNLLSSMSEMVLMLSATPLNLRNDDLFNQMHILNPSAFPDKGTFETLQSPVIRLNRISRLLAADSQESRISILSILNELAQDRLGQAIFAHSGVKNLVSRLQDEAPLSPQERFRYERLFVSLNPLYYSFTRTRKREAFEHQIYREVVEVPVHLTADEMEFQDRFLDIIKQHYLSMGMNPMALGLVINVHRRMVSSCIAAAIQYLEWSLKENKILSGEGEDEETEDDSQILTSKLDQDLNRSLSNLFLEYQHLENLDTKYNYLKSMLERMLVDSATSQVIIFSFFVRTLEYLRKRLEKDGFKVGVIHGQVPIEGASGVMGRSEVMDQFKKGAFNILLSSEVGGEGLDFQYCHAIINYDLPYNPMRIEQRIGRVDRFGQAADKIITANFFIKSTVDEEIYDRLYRRIRLIEDGVGSLEQILGKELADIQTLIISGSVNEQEKIELQKRLEEHIAAAKIEMEEFETRSRELLGDDYLSMPINEIPQSNLVIPQDLLEITKMCIASWEGCTFKKIDAGCAEIFLSPKVKSELELFLRRPGNERGHEELAGFLKHRSPVRVVFDGSRAEALKDDSSHYFLSIAGCWPRFLINKLEQEKRLFRAFSFSINDDGLLGMGEFLVLLFEVRTEGLRKETQFLGIPLNLSTAKVVETRYEHLARRLADARPSQEPIKNGTGRISPDDLERYLNKTLERLSEIIEERRDEAYEDNIYITDSRIAALEKSTEVRVRKLQEQLDTHITNRQKVGQTPDVNYVRLTTARIEKENQRRDLMVENLKKRRVLTMDYNLVGVVHLTVQGDEG